MKNRNDLEHLPKPEKERFLDDEIPAEGEPTVKPTGPGSHNGPFIVETTHPALEVDLEFPRGLHHIEPEGSTLFRNCWEVFAVANQTRVFPDDILKGVFVETTILPGGGVLASGVHFIPWELLPAECIGPASNVLSWGACRILVETPFEPAEVLLARAMADQ